MSSNLLIKSKLILPTVWKQTVRYRGKFNHKMPHPRHDIARYLEEITKPVLIKEIKDPIDGCLTYKSRLAKSLKFSTNEAIEFEKFLAGYAHNLFNKYECVLVCHKLDCAGESLRRNKVEFKKNETVMWNFNKVVMSLFIEQNPKYENLYPLVSTGLGRNYYFFFQEKYLNKNLTLIRKIPHFTLLGGMIHGRLFTRNGVQNYLNMPNLEQLRGQLLSNLNQHLSLISNTLTMPINNLTQLLTQHAKSDENKAQSQ